MTMRILAWPAFSNTGNPYNALLYEHLQKVSPAIVEDFSLTRFFLRNWDIWHLHWPERLPTEGRLFRISARLLVFVVLLILARLFRMKLVWTVHNLAAHNRAHPRLEALFMDRFVRRVDGIILLTQRSLQLAWTRFPAVRTKPVAVIPHGHYLDYYASSTGRAEARASLNLEDDGRVLLFIGRINPYKNVVELIQQFRLMSEPNLALVVAGESQQVSLKNEIKLAASGDQRIRLHLHPVSDNRLHLFLNAADLVVAPFKAMLNSGTVLLALSFARPVLVPRVGSMTELESTFGTDWIRTYSEPLTAEALREASLRPAASSADQLVTRLREELGWESIATQTATFFDALILANRRAK